MDQDQQIRAVALVAAALQPHPGNAPLFDRADIYFQYIKEAKVGEKVVESDDSE